MAFGPIEKFYIFSAAQWASSVQILGTKEAGIESDTGKIKHGNGRNIFSALSYLPCCGGGGSVAFGDITGSPSDAGITGQQVDISWADLMTALTGGTLSINTIYHTTSAPDGSTYITDVWVRALKVDQLANTAYGLMTNATITNRPCKVYFNYAGADGSKLTGYEDSFENKIFHTSLAGIEAWISELPSARYGWQINQATLNSSPAGLIRDYSVFKKGASITIGSDSEFGGIVEESGIAAIEDAGSIFTGIIGRASSVNIQNGSSAMDMVMEPSTNLNVGLIAAAYVSNTEIKSNNTLNVDTGFTLSYARIGYVDQLSVDFTGGGTVTGFDTSGNNKIVSGAANPTGDTLTATINTGLAIVQDGSSDVTISIPDGVHLGQQMIVFFAIGSAAITWSGNFNSSSTPSTVSSPDKIILVWDGSKWY